MPTCTSAFRSTRASTARRPRSCSSWASQRLRLITNNPAKCDDLGSFGIEIAERVSLPARSTPENITYLETKRRRMGHLLAGLETSVG